MEPLTFADITQLLNNSRTTKINVKPIAQSPGNWELYEGEHRVHTDRILFEVLYLQSKASADGLREAKRRLKPDITHVVYASSLDARQKSHRELFQDKAKGFWTTKQYIASFIHDELEAYKGALIAQAPKHYVDPDVEVPAGMRRKIPNPLFSFLADSPASPDALAGGLGILLAEPGQGKTYMSQYLVSKMAGLAPSRELFPIYINSDQWQSIAPDDFVDLPKTITHSFGHLGTPIGWLAGCEEKFLEVTLKAGLFRIVFDGFDEYVLRNHGRVTATEAMSVLARFVDITGTRIVVTSRTSFWNSELESVSRHFEETRLSVYTQLPFDTGKAKSYFSARLLRPASVERATNLYADLQKTGKEFVGRGFVLNLLANLVERDPGTLPSVAGNPIEWLMHAICEREKLRQDLPLSAEEQINAISLFVAECAQGAVPNSDLLETAISLVATHLGADSRRDCIKKLSSHPLIQRPSASSDSWKVPQDQVRVVLLARYLMNLTVTPASELRLFATKARIEDSFAGDVAEMIVDLTLPESDKEARLRRIIGAILSAQNISNDSSLRQDCLRRLAVMVALRAVDRLLSKGTAHKDRTLMLVSLLPAGLRDLDFSGAITRMNFETDTFDRCRFEHVRWANCQFSSATRFKDCDFVGGSETYCEGLGLAKWQNFTADEEGRAFINSVCIKEGQKKYTSEDLGADIRFVMDKFIKKGSIAFKSVKESHVGSGPVGVSPHKDLIIDEVTKRLLERHEISGISEKGLNVREDAKDCMRFYAANNVFTGALQDVFERLQKKLGLS
jgi:hypothetical protein